MDITFVRSNKVQSLVNSRGKSELFEGIIEPNDINQGQLGDCYLLTSLACLAEYPERIKKLFIEHEYNEQGIYGVVCHTNGCKHEVVVDDHIPCIGNSYLWRPKFS